MKMHAVLRKKQNRQNGMHTVPCRNQKKRLYHRKGQQNSPQRRRLLHPQKKIQKHKLREKQEGANGQCALFF